jgi:heme-degrading monooxygenase HmoA
VSVVEHAHLMITAGREKEFEEAYLEAEPLLTGSSGCQEAGLFRDSEEPSSYLLRVRWEKLADHLEVFPASAEGQKFVSIVGPFFASTPQVRHFDADAVGDKVEG